MSRWRYIFGADGILAYEYSQTGGLLTTYNYESTILPGLGGNPEHRGHRCRWHRECFHFGPELEFYSKINQFRRFYCAMGQHRIKPTNITPIHADGLPRFCVCNGFWSYNLAEFR